MKAFFKKLLKGLQFAFADGFHGIAWRAFGQQLALHVIHVGSHMAEELMIALAEIIEVRLSIGGLRKTVLRASSVTSEEVAAAAALTWQTPLLHPSELKLPFTIHHLQERVLSDVSKLIFREDKVVARVYVSVELHDSCMPAAACHRA